MKQPQHLQMNVDQTSGKQRVVPQVFDIDVFEGYTPEKADVQVTDLHLGLELPGEIFLGLTTDIILDERGLDQEKNQQENDKDGEKRPQ